LQNVLERFHQHGLFPVIAPEVEFYLTGNGALDPQNQGCFQMDTSTAHAALLMSWNSWHKASISHSPGSSLRLNLVSSN
jgi:glutamine synthetase